MKPTDQIEDATLYHGDCLAVMGSLSSASVDLVITSPPYNLGATPWPALGHWRPGHKCSGGEGKWKRGSASSARGVAYGSHRDSMPWSEYVEWQREVISVLWDKLTATGAIFYNHKPRVVGDRLWLPLELIPDHVSLRQVIVWDRGGGINYTTTALVPNHEWILLLAKPDFRLATKAVSGVGDVWRMNPASGNSHPAPFPWELPHRCLEVAGGRTVLDPFMGSGTTIVAAMRHGRNPIGIELDPKHYATAKRKVIEATGTGAGQLFAGVQ